MSANMSDIPWRHSDVICRANTLRS